MYESIFRKKSLEYISSPEEMDDYMKVTNLGMWLVLASVIFLLAAVMLWGITGEIEANVMVNGELMTKTIAPISLLTD